MEAASSSGEHPELKEAVLESQCTALVRDYSQSVSTIDEARDLYNLDISSQEAREKHIVAGNEIYVGRRVCMANIKRELPTMIQYLTGSYRHVSARARPGTQLDTGILSAVESELTDALRSGNWLTDHIQAVSSMQLHGRGVFMVVPEIDPLSVLGCKIDYVAPENFVFPVKTKNLQKCPMLGVIYELSSIQLKKWATDYQWTPDIMAKYNLDDTNKDHTTLTYKVYLMLKKVNDIVMSFWYSEEHKKLMSKPVQFNAGLFDANGKAQPTKMYPIFPIFYDINDNPALIERHGRAFLDMHDQEALTMGHTAILNACLRSAELYASRDQPGNAENPEVTQTDFQIEPGYVVKSPIKFHSPPSPDPVMLTALQNLKTENASDANQVDFAATARKDSRKTAKELSLAADQASEGRTVPITMFSIGYDQLLTYIWDIVQHNVASQWNRGFMAANQEIRALVAQKLIRIRPAGDIDYLERNEKLKRYTNFYPMFADKGRIAIFFLEKILEYGFPDEYPQMKPLLQDNTAQMGAALLELVKGIPPGVIPPEMQAKFQEIVANAEQVFAQNQQQGQQDAPEATTQTAAG